MSIVKNIMRYRLIRVVLLAMAAFHLVGCSNMMEVHPVDLSKTILEMNFLAYQSLPKSTVSGRVVLCSLNNNGHPNVAVTLKGSWETHSVKTNNQGVFVIPGVRTGAYTLSANLNGFAFEPVSQSIFVGISDVNDLQLTTMITWNKTYGGAGYDRANAVLQTSDCGYVVTGYSDSQQPGNREFYVMKLNMFGDVVWQRIYGGSGSENAYALTKTTDNGFLICGYTNSSGAGLNDVTIIKIDANGNQLWQKWYGGHESDAGYSMATTSDGGSVIAGFTDSSGNGGSDAWIIRVDANGNHVWDYTFGGQYTDVAYSIKPVSTGGFVVVGTQELASHVVNIWVLRLDDQGQQVWGKTFHNGEYSEAVDVRETPDGGFILGGSTSDADGNCLLMKLDANGDLQWQKLFGQSNTDAINSVAVTTEGGYITAGYSYSNIVSENDLYIVKFDHQGSIEWQQLFDGDYHHEDVARSISQTSDAGYIVGGYTQTYYNKDDIWVIKLNRSGLSP